jgi:TolA-binding protein
MASGTTNHPEGAPSWVEDVVRRMQEVVERQDTQIQQQSAQIQSLEQQLQQQRQARTADPASGGLLTPRTNTTEKESEATSKTEHLPKPPEFSGERSEFRSWLTQMYAKLLVDKTHEPESVRFWYIYTRPKESKVIFSRWVTMS